MQVENNTDFFIKLNNLEFYAHVIVMPIVLSVGVVGQTLNLLTLYQKSLKNSCFVYLKSVAWAELLSVFFYIPYFVRVASIYNRWTYSTPYFLLWFEAYLEVPLINMFVAANSLSIVVLTCDRYVSVCHPIFARTLTKAKTKSRVVCCCIYIFAAILYIPSCFTKFILTLPMANGQNRTLIFRNADLHNAVPFRIYLILREICTRIGPILFVVVLNVLIVAAFRQATLRHRRLQSQATSQAEARCLTSTSVLSAKRGSRVDEKCYDSPRRLYVLIGITVVTFFLCTLPASVLALMVTDQSIKELSIEFQTFKAAANLLEVLSYCINFYVYCLCSQDYRHAFIRRFRTIRSSKFDAITNTTFL